MHEEMLRFVEVPTEARLVIEQSYLREAYDAEDAVLGEEAIVPEGAPAIGHEGFRTLERSAHLKDLPMRELGVQRGDHEHARALSFVFHGERDTLRGLPNVGVALNPSGKNNLGIEEREECIGSCDRSDSYAHHSNEKPKKAEG